MWLCWQAADSALGTESNVSNNEKEKENFLSLETWAEAVAGI